MDFKFTGYQHVISFVDSKGRKHQARIGSIAAQLLSYTVDDDQVIVTQDENEFSQYFSGYTLYPWPNRLEDGQYTLYGNTIQAPINEPGLNNQLHGLAISYNFEQVDKAENFVELSLVLPPLIYYPFLTRLNVRFELCESGFKITTTATNLGPKAAPIGIGIHPWLSVRGSMDNATLEINANKYVEVNERLIPIGEVEVSGNFDLRKPKSLKGISLDHAFVDITPNSDGKNEAILVGADGKKTTITSDATFPAWQICTANGFLGDHHRFGIAIEPQTCYANAFKTGNNIIHLAAAGQDGDTFSGDIVISFE